MLHDAVLLMDRLASTGAVVQPDQLYVMMAACVKVARPPSARDPAVAPPTSPVYRYSTGADAPALQLNTLRGAQKS